MKNSCLIIIIYLFVLADAGYCNPDKDLQININVSEASFTYERARQVILGVTHSSFQYFW